MVRKLSFFDVETTGLSPEYGDRICEIGILNTDEFEIEQTYTTLVNPQREISPGAYGVNGITNDMVKNAPLFADIADKCLTFIAGRIIVCHNARFDMSFLKYELSLLNKLMVKNQVIDTLQLARKYFNFSSNSLQSIASHLGIKTQHKHRALSDAHLTREVLMYFNKQLRKYKIDVLSEATTIPKRKIDISLPLKLEEVIKTGKKIRIKYISGAGDVTVRTIAPIEIIKQNDYIYLIAYCYLRAEERIFRLDRILNFKLL